MKLVIDLGTRYKLHHFYLIVKFIKFMLKWAVETSLDVARYIFTVHRLLLIISVSIYVVFGPKVNRLQFKVRIKHFD